MQRREDWMRKKRESGGAFNLKIASMWQQKEQQSLMQAKVDGTSKRNSSSSSMAVQCVAFLFLSFY